MGDSIMDGTEKQFSAKKGDKIIRGSIWVEGTPDNREWAAELESAVYDRLAELERGPTTHEG